MEKRSEISIITSIVEYFGRRRSARSIDFANNELVTPLIPLKIPWYGSTYLNLPGAVSAVITFPDGRQSVRKESGVLNFPPGNYGLNFVNMRRQITHVPDVRAKSIDAWRVLLSVDVTWQIRHPSQIVNTQQPLFVLENLCRAAVVNFIQSATHNELVSTPGTAPLKEEDIARGILERLNANPGLSGFHFINVNLLARQGDSGLIEPMHEQVLNKSSLHPLSIQISCHPEEVQLGEFINLKIDTSRPKILKSTPIDIKDKIPDELELTINAPGLIIPEGKNIAVITLSEDNQSTIYRLKTFLAGPQKITIQPYFNRQKLPSISRTVQVNQAEQKERPLLADPIGPRSIPQPDLSVRVYAIHQDSSSFSLKYVLYSPHYALHLPGVPVGSVNLNKADIDRLIVRLEHGLQNRDTYTNILSETLLAIGHSLYDLLLPAPLKNAYLDFHDKIKNILFLTDPIFWVPWEFIKPYGPKWEHDFLAERYSIGRWIDGWGALRRAEFPIGQVGHVQATGVKKYQTPAEWNELFSEGDIPRISETLFQDWPGGYSAAMVYDTPIWGLHFETISEKLGENAKEIVAMKDSDLSPEKVRDYALDLHAKRPLVTFSSLSPGPETTLSGVESRWLPTFIQSGASAFGSTYWSTPPHVDRLFWQTFYREIWNRHSLGEAISHARKVLRQTYPDSWNWLAYFLVGDPMSIGYIPHPGDGFITLECLNYDLDQQLSVGETYSFVASLRTTPPPWYQDRLYQSPADDWAEPSIQIFAPEFDILPSSVIPLGEAVQGMQQVRFDLSPRKPQTADVFVNFVSAHRDVRQTLSFSVDVVAKGKHP